MYRQPWIASLLVLILLIAISLYSIHLVRPPDALPANAPPDQFSAGRALQQLRRVAQEPHAIGTPAHATVRAYLLATMRQLGLQPIVQEATVANRHGGGVAGYVYNIMGRLKGKAGGKAVLLMAHYDSQPNTPGAGDDGAGVVALLETARAIRQGAPLQRDIIFLLTDGEEAGLYGASAFMRHSWAKDVGFVMNVEARGTGGPSMTFEISPQNGWVVNEFAKAAPYPFASSLMYEIYRSLPNSTDFTIFRDAGYSGVNSAFIDGFVNYHKLTDTPDNLNINSLQHHGSNMLALARHVANLPLTSTKAPDKVFFNPAGSWLVQYPMWMNWFWVVFLTGTLVAVVQLGVRKRVLTIGQSFVGLLLYIAIFGAVTGGFLLINPMVRTELPYSHAFNGIYGSDRFLVAYALLTVGVTGLLGRVALRWVSLFSLQMGVYLFVFIVTLALQIVLPSATYQFMFPLLFCLLGTLVVLRQLPQGATLKTAATGWLVLGALPALFMLMPLVKLLFVTFDLQLPIASMAMLTITLGLVLAVFLHCEQGLRWRNWPVLPLLVVVAGGSRTLLAIRQEMPGDQQPLHSQESYYLNADTNEAFWASDFKLTDDWNKQFFTNASIGPFTEMFPTATRDRLKSRAAVLPLAVPTAEVISDSATAGGRQLTLRLHSVRGAAGLQILLMPNAETDLTGCLLNGEQLTPKVLKTPSGPVFTVQLMGLPVTKEATLRVNLKSASPVRVILYDESIGLPASLIKKPRPTHVVFEQGPASNEIFVRKTYQF